MSPLRRSIAGSPISRVNSGRSLFDRRPRGVRLTAAGEVFVHYLRGHNGEVERMKSQIEDLKGLRRGTVRIACSQALALDFLPRQIAEFRKSHPLVSFELKVVDHEWAMAALAAYEVDLVVVFRPPFTRQLSAIDDARTAIGGSHGEKPSARRAKGSSGSGIAPPILSRCRSDQSAAGNCSRKFRHVPDSLSISLQN